MAVILDYRVPNNRQGALHDAQRSLSLVRSRAKEFGINDKEIGVLGFFAAGHLAASVSTFYGQASYSPIDNVDKISNRPDFTLLIYPAYLIGPEKLPSSEVRPHQGMPSFFLTQTMDDPYLWAPAYASALNDAGVPESLLIYDTAGHGYGLRLPETTAAHDWSNWAAIWLKATVGE